MNNWLELNYVQTFQQLPNSLYSPVTPQALSNPKLVAASPACAALFGLDEASLNDDVTLKILSGQSLLSNWQPIAMKYTGHQFGYYNPDLGDGRGVLLSQVAFNHKTWDLHLKGAGLTPYSRQGDGRAVLRSSIREFLCSEALAALNVPTTRALCVVDTDTPVYREQAETGATVLRVSQSHIRFGHFEFCSFTQQTNLLKTLCDHVIAHHFNELLNKDSHNIYVDFFQAVLTRTAHLMAHWQSIGFAHGVMNTDNMSIIGDTFDFGPFAFLDDYDPSFICNHSDHQGRYAFNQQPNIANWNLAVLAQALLPLADKESLVNILEDYPSIFEQSYFEKMTQKLGLTGDAKTHQSIIENTLSMMKTCRLDFSYFFRQLANIHQPETHKHLRDLCLDITAFDNWFTAYKAALKQNQQALNSEHDDARKTRMNQVNPKYILRNYLAQNAITAAQNGDYSEVQKLFTILQKPFDEQTEFNHYANLPPEWGKTLEISCSS
ncbi:protein adenylyltransferase SelO [Bermanella sp. WJH001]|uniref:protein adenylyltransferase SelO n=1 Tax=Bermanella sp. WJH001 TaxID=3048005 RepID=UPI0024BDDD86|nr:YdiU family protein [Bermanella sp. WJH001]MDJ1536666.1 YdiU family protein [Bermanella sp. WJH001]